MKVSDSLDCWTLSLVSGELKNAQHVLTSDPPEFFTLNEESYKLGHDNLPSPITGRVEFKVLSCV